MDPADAHLAPAFVSALQVAVGLLFLVAVVPKLLHPKEFAEAIDAYAFLPLPAARIVSFTLAPIELAVGISLLTGFFAKIGLVIAFLTLSAFLAAVGVALRRNLSIPCGCFGRASEPISRRSVVRLAMLLLATGLIIVSVSKLGASPFLPHSYVLDGEEGLRHVLSISAMAGFIVIGGLWILTLPEVLALRSTSEPRDEASGDSLARGI